MLRAILALVLALLVTGSTALAAMQAAPLLDEGSPRPAPVHKPIGMHSHEHVGDHPAAAAAPVAVGSLIERARFLLTEQDLQGLSAKEWVARADAQRLLELRAPLREDADLEREIERLHAAVGAAPSAAAADSARVPPELRGPFASLVAAVADAYEAQRPLADDALERWPTPRDASEGRLTPAQRDAMTVNAERLMGAINAFAAAMETVSLPADTRFADSLGLVRLGGPGDDVHLPGGEWPDPVLLVDVGGNDTYFTSSGGACPDPRHLAHRCNGLALSVVLDLAGSDVHLHDGAPAAVQGSGSMGGLGVLVDLDGDDRYHSTMTRSEQPPLSMYVDGGAQGFGQAGLGILLDASGDDEYVAQVASSHGRSIWLFGQGGAGAGGFGALVDAQGDDRYLARGLGIPCLGGYGGGSSCGFQGVYNNGVGFYGGVGILSDIGMGNDRYHAWNNGTTVDYYAQGFGAYGGVGILHEDGGHDDYIAYESASDPWIQPLLNCAFGTGSLGGVGILLEMGGHDRYHGETVSPRAAATMNEGYGGLPSAYGLFMDLSGDDGHFMYANGGPGSYTAGRGLLLVGGNLGGTYLDLGGVDEYEGADRGDLGRGGSRDNGVWFAGADLNLPDPARTLGWPA